MAGLPGRRQDSADKITLQKSHSPAEDLLLGLLCALSRPETEGGQPDHPPDEGLLSQKGRGGPHRILHREGEDGLYRRFTGNETVILVTGDIGSNPDMLHTFCLMGLIPKRNGYTPQVPDPDNPDPCIGLYGVD